MMKEDRTFKEIYNSLPEPIIEAPKTKWIDRIATITKKSRKTIYCYLAGTQFPDALTQSVIAKELGVEEVKLFPNDPKNQKKK